jgi:hypothetical protein
MTIGSLWRLWSSFIGWRPATLTPSELGLMQCTMSVFITSYKSVEVGGVTFWDSHVKEDRSWFMFPSHPDDNGVMYFGQIHRIFSHEGPTGTTQDPQGIIEVSILLEVQYFCAEKRVGSVYEPFDYLMCAPFVNSKAVRMPYGNIWRAADIAPVAITVVPHPEKKSKLLVLHRDIFFPMFGGHPAPDVARLLL